MTELMNAARLRQDALDIPSFPPQPVKPVLRWTIDLRTERPVGYWELGGRLTASSLPES
jgi:hypothetical protein